MIIVARVEYIIRKSIADTVANTRKTVLV